jgi:flagellin
MAANKGAAVSSQSAADGIASRLDAAFSSITFYQEREVSSYTGNSPIVTDGVVTGSLIGSGVTLRQDGFDSVMIDSIRVSAPQGSNENASISFTIDGTTYNSEPNIGGTLGANQTYRFTSAENAEEYLEFTTGNSTIQLDTDAKAAAFQNALADAFGVGNGDAELKFQVGVTTEDTLSVGINDVTTNTIYQGRTLDVLTQQTAAAASDALDAAIDMVTSVRAEVGALQSRFDFAAANIESSISNQDAARGVLLDTDVAAESTAFATSQVQLQAGISVLAQANLLQQNLLKLIG